MKNGVRRGTWLVEVLCADGVWRHVSDAPTYASGLELCSALEDIVSETGGRGFSEARVRRVAA